MSQPRASTDEETAPLLNQEREHDTFFSALLHPARPLTNLEKILAGVGILLLLLTSTFIGLFAGAKHALNKGRGDHGNHGGWQTTTIFSTTTDIATATKTSVATTTISTIPTGKPKQEVCLSEECVLLSAQILQSLNTSVDPCDDFYEFATGGWQASHEIPADRGVFGSFNEVALGNKKIILKVLDSIPDKLEKTSPENANLYKLKSFYTSCIDVDRLNDVGLKPILPLANELLELFGPFDLIPAPEEDLVDAASWSGTYDDSYKVPAEVVATGEKVEIYRNAKKSGSKAWPRLEKAQIDVEDSFSDFDVSRRQRITKTLAWLHSRGVDALVNFNIEGDAGGEDSQIQSLWLYQAFGGLPSKEYYEEKPILDLYTSVVKGVLIDIASHTHASDHKNNGKDKRDVIDDLVALAEEEFEVEGWPWPWPGDDDKGRTDEPSRPPTKDEPIEDRIGRLASKVVAFERELIRAGADPENLFNPHFAYNPYSTKKVGKGLPFLDIPTYLSVFDVRRFPANITVTHPPYLKSVTHLVDTTPDYVLSGYFVTRLALRFASALGPKTGVRAETRRLEEVLSGLKKGTEENRQDVCLGRLDDVVGFIAGREFVREAFSPEAKKEGEDIIKSIVQAFHDKLPHISWMDAESAKAAQKKAEAIIPKVGYPLAPNTTDPTSIAYWYGRLDIQPEDYFGNILKSTLLEEIRAWSSLGRSRNRDTWEMYPQTVNAYYSPPDGEIVFPAGILQPPFYSHAWPAHLNYGAFGAVAAHELTHAFDNSGSQYDDKGRLRDWWTNTTVQAFEEKAQCIAKQYSKYYVLDAEGKKVHVNGNLTNGEDIADSGLAQAYLAWKNSVKSSSESDAEIRLPGLDYNQDQLFFLAFARVWATLTRPATAVSRVRTDPHSPPYWRATGTLRNLDAFHKAFNCKAGSKMNPPKEEQCELW